MTKAKKKATKSQSASKGGIERDRRLTPERKKEIARQGAIQMWANRGKEPPAIAKYGAPDRPLKIGPIEIPCYVLADGTRVLAQRGLQSGIGLSEGGGKGGARKLVSLMEHFAGKGINIRDIIARANSPIRFIPPHGGNPGGGYDARILPDICAVVIDAATKGVLSKRQQRLAEQCAILQHGFATVGIIALVDEATGYEEFRARDALAMILERFVAKEMRPWIKTFPAEFYKQIYRLNGWDFKEGSTARPGIVGHWTTNIVYKRLAPGVWEELKSRTPRLESGRLKSKMFQWLTDEVGHPKLREHLAGVLMIMKYAPNWKVFMVRLDAEYPQWGKTLLLPFPTDYQPPALPPGDDDSEE